jgi:predicted  nucleic acid-binding Zn-ribbon protein
MQIKDLNALLEGKDCEAARILYTVKQCDQHKISDLEEKLAKLTTEKENFESELQIHTLKIETHETLIAEKNKEVEQVKNSFKLKSESIESEQKALITKQENFEKEVTKHNLRDRLA